MKVKAGLHRLPQKKTPLLASLFPHIIRYASTNNHTCLRCARRLARPLWSRRARLRSLARVLTPRRPRTFPRAHAHDIREASKSFSTHTSRTFDGLHPRHFSLLGDDALNTLGALIETIERIGSFPEQAAFLVFPLIPKPKGGMRAILAASGLVRVWERLRRPQADGFLESSEAMCLKRVEYGWREPVFIRKLTQHLTSSQTKYGIASLSSTNLTLCTVESIQFTHMATTQRYGMPRSCIRRRSEKQECL